MIFSTVISGEIISAIIALVGVLIGTLISYIVAKKTSKFNYDELFAKNITTSRMEWINVWRTSISNFCTNVKVYASYKTNLGTNEIEIVSKIEKAKNDILIRLNLNEEKHILFYKLITDLDYRVISLNSDELEKIMYLGREILKEEWERVKKESRGMKKSV